MPCADARRPFDMGSDDQPPGAASQASWPHDGLMTASGLHVGALPAKQRAAVVHRYVLDLTYREIGERMGISEEAARQNVSAGLRRLRRR